MIRVANSTPPGQHWPKNALARAIRSLSPHRKPRPPPILIPPPTIDPTLPVAKSMDWVAVEISNYPPNFTRQDLQTLFRNYNVSPSFNLPKTTRFVYPFRTIVFLAGIEEASRAVRNLTGLVVGGREIAVRMLGRNRADVEERVVGAEQMVEELKIGIINTAHIYWPHLATAILEVREYTKDGQNFAFLQRRSPITVNGKSEKPQGHNIGDWGFVAGAIAETGRTANERLEALRNLQEHVEKQGVIKRIWSKWEGSQMLDTPREQGPYGL